ALAQADAVHSVARHPASKHTASQSTTERAFLIEFAILAFLLRMGPRATHPLQHAKSGAA
ncbi:MAG: hypothetical protein ACLVKI_05245, partial [Gordonibacter urolithinfaciens]